LSRITNINKSNILIEKIRKILDDTIYKQLQYEVTFRLTEMPERKIQDYEWPPNISFENHIVGIISDGEGFNFILSDGQRSKLPIKGKAVEYCLDATDEIYKVVLRSRDS